MQKIKEICLGPRAVRFDPSRSSEVDDFRVIWKGFRLRSQISPEQIKTSTSGKRHYTSAIQPLPRWTKNWMNFGPLTT